MEEEVFCFPSEIAKYRLVVLHGWGADAEDLSLTIHPHPTLSETLSNSAEVFEGTVTDIFIPK